MHFTEFDTRLAAYALIVNDADEILLTWYNGEDRNYPKWSMPGGGVEFDETIPDAVVREVYEETGYRVELGEFLTESHFTVMRSRANGRPFRAQRFIYRAVIVGGQLGTTEVGGSTDFARWIPLSKVSSLPEERADIVDLAVSCLTDSREGVAR